MSNSSKPGLLIGIHVSMAGGLLKTINRIKDLKIESAQVFSGNPRAFYSKAIDPEKAEVFRTELEKIMPGPLVVHAPYPMNLATFQNRDRSVKMLINEIVRCRLLGGTAVVFHPGNHLGAGLKNGIALVADAIKVALDSTQSDVILAIENTTGAGTSLGSSLEELTDIINQADGDKRVGFWLDTAHAFGAGYRLNDPAGIDDWLDQADNLIGLESLVGLHINDSKGVLGSKIDRHEHLGKGLIGADCLGRILSDRRLSGLPGILETPKTSEDDEKFNLRRARLYKTRALSV